MMTQSVIISHCFLHCQMLLNVTPTFQSTTDFPTIQLYDCSQETVTHTISSKAVLSVTYAASTYPL
uniref:Uncharacterized protein n=1 Tax=Arion vulgaris TaxID=1028688 RepID=A0A0B7BEZ8_9EUPU